MLRIIEACDNVASELLRNKLLEAHVSHPLLQHRSVVLVPLLPSLQSSLLSELLESLSEGQDCVGRGSKP